MCASHLLTLPPRTESAVGDAPREELVETSTEFVVPDSLSLLQKILLSTDGTVTHIVEAYAGERIVVVKLSQSLRSSQEDVPELLLVEPEAVLRREVLLQGSQSGRNFIHAESVILADRLPLSVRRALMETDEPLGKVLSQSRMETFREILSWRKQPAGPCAEHFGVDPSAITISRSYRISSGQRPIMLIRETFPITSFVSL